LIPLKRKSYLFQKITGWFVFVRETSLEEGNNYGKGSL